MGHADRSGGSGSHRVPHSGAARLSSSGPDQARAGGEPAATSGAVNPFVTPPDARDPVRRARGRLVAPVTIVTSHGSGGPAGLTVSSLIVAEGEPPLAYFLLGSTSDLYDAIEESGVFVVHVCGSEHREASDVFAEIRPAPGGKFAGRAVEEGTHGPVLSDVTTRLHCTLQKLREESFSVLVSGSIDRIENADLSDPLAYFRGRYRQLQ